MHGRRFVFLFLIAIMSSSNGTINVAAAEQPSSGKFLAFTHAGEERKYLLHLPQELPEKAPLVFMLHGYRGDARDYMAELGVKGIADKNGFALCVPQGARDVKGIPHWNARLKISRTNDIDFLSKLAIQLQQSHRLDPARTFLCGVSNGGFMSYTLVAERPDVFRAAASVIGTMSGYTWKHRSQIQPAPILQISGLNDEVVPYDGSMSRSGGWGGAPHQQTIMDFWSKLNKTRTAEVVQISDRTTAHYYRKGTDDHEVWHYKVKGFGHRIPGTRELGDTAFDIVWQFFSKY